MLLARATPPRLVEQRAPSLEVARLLRPPVVLNLPVHARPEQRGGDDEVADDVSGGAAPGAVAAGMLRGPPE